MPKTVWPLLRATGGPCFAPPVALAWNNTAHSKAFLYQIHGCTTMPPLSMLVDRSMMLFVAFLSLRLKTTLTTAWPTDTFGRAYDVA
jgi:drug/metabolite transporter superfamily protein YnfA